MNYAQDNPQDKGSCPHTGTEPNEPSLIFTQIQECIHLSDYSSTVNPISYLTMNGWLGFSLSPQADQTTSTQSTHDQNHSSSAAGAAAVSHLISGDFTLSADHSATELFPMGIPTTIRPDASFGVLEAFNRNHHQHQDWKTLDFKDAGSSELSMLVGSSSNHRYLGDNEPRLEDFLGGNSFSDHHLPSNSSFHVQDTKMAATTQKVNANGSAVNNSIGLSMIKNWLRNNPAAPTQAERTATEEVGGGGTGANCDGAMVGNVIDGAAAAVASQSLSLSMSTGSQPSSALPFPPASVADGGMESLSSENQQKSAACRRGGPDAQTGATEAVPRKSLDTFGQRTSIYRGVTRHRWTGRYEAHLWDNSCRNEGQTRKGKQVYLGGYDKEDKAARSYDLAALKYWGPTTTTNFPVSNYTKELEEMKRMTRDEYVASLRRKSSGFSRGASIYRGVTRHHQHGRWQARIGRVAGNKDLYLGTFSTQEEAAEAYDIAAIKFRGRKAVTNFEMNRYDVQAILDSSTLPIGNAAKRLKEATELADAALINGRRTSHVASHFDHGVSSYLSQHGWPTISFHQPPAAFGIHYQQQQQQQQYPYEQLRGGWCKQEQDDVVAAAHNLHDLHHFNLNNSGSSNIGSTQYNFFQQPSTVLHNLMSLESSSSVEQSTGSSSFIYNSTMNSYCNGSGDNGGGGDYSGGYNMMPMSTVVTDQSLQGSSITFAADSSDQGKQLGFDGYNLIGINADSYATAPTRNAYYLGGSVGKVNGYDQSSSVGNAWLPSQSAAARSADIVEEVGASGTAWNEA